MQGIQPTRCGVPGLPVVEPVIESLHAVQLGVRLKGLADVEDAIHAGGVPLSAEVANRAGHSVEILLRVYAKCIDGGEEAANRRIDEALAA